MNDEITRIFIPGASEIEIDFSPQLVLANGIGFGGLIDLYADQDLQEKIVSVSYHEQKRCNITGSVFFVRVQRSSTEIVSG